MTRVWQAVIGVALIAVLGRAAVLVAKSSGHVAGAGQTPGAVAAPRLTADSQPLAAFLGDSYTLGTGAKTPADRWSTKAARQLGWREVNFGVGSTGYTKTTAAEGQPYVLRVPAVAAEHPSIVVVAGGRNDVFGSPAVDSKDVTALFTALRAALPAARIYAESPVWDSSTPPAVLATLAADVQANVGRVHGTYLNVGQPLAGKPADIISDHVDPDHAGHVLLAAAFVRANRTTL